MAKFKFPTAKPLPRKTVTDATDKGTIQRLEGEAREACEDSL